MPLEIERKFLVNAKKLAKLNLRDGEKICQGYLSTSPTVRVRIKNDRGYLTIKGANHGIVRSEFEYEIPLRDAEEILQLCEHSLEKTRYKIKFAGHIFELDIFEGRHAGLILAEVEMKSPDEIVKLPNWIGREVSNDPRYYNSNLAKDLEFSG